MIGSHVHGQTYIPPGVTVSCYDTDSTCSVLQNEMEYNYARPGDLSRESEAVNICCFDMSSIASHRASNYYISTGSKCQFCSGN